MKMKVVSAGLVIVLLSMGMVVITCGYTYPDDLIILTVQFNPNGGTPAPNNQRILSDAKAIHPQAMIKTGYYFDSWFMEDNLGTEWDFNTDTVTTDMTLYAGWESVPAGSFAVTFITNGGSFVPDQIKTAGALLDPVSSTRSGYALEGWYTEAGLVTQWDFANTITGTKSLYARWIRQWETGFSGTNYEFGSWLNPNHSYGYDPAKDAYWVENAKVGNGQFTCFQFDSPVGIDLTGYSGMSVDMAVDNAALANDMQWLFVRFWNDGEFQGQTRLRGMSEGQKEIDMANNPGVFVTVGDSETVFPQLFFGDFVDREWSNITSILFYIEHKAPHGADLDGKIYIRNILFF